MTAARISVLAAALVALGAPGARADVRLPALFSDHMVLQRDAPLSVWGWAAPGERVAVEAGGRRAEATAGPDGRWQVRLEPLAAGGPLDLTVAGRTTRVVRDVLVGDVWLCAGQSNMEMPLEDAAGAETEVPRADRPRLRLFVPAAVTPSDEPQADLPGAWVVCRPETARTFSAVGYYFGREVQDRLGAAVGLVGAYCGGSPAEAWLSRDAYEADPGLRTIRDHYYAELEGYVRNREKVLAKWREEADRARTDGRPVPPAPEPLPDLRTLPGRPSALFNALIAPLAPAAIRGALWYQGESNVGRSEDYARLLQGLIRDWRRHAGQGDFPFLLVQLPNHHERRSQPAESRWADLREAQARALALPRTALAVTIDLGDAADPHPKQKAEVGRRLAFAALAAAYGLDVAHSGPTYESMSLEGRKVRLRFRDTAGGLVARGGRLTGFAVAGDDRRFVWADGRIEGDTVLVWNPGVPRPAAVRYAWADNPECGLYNGAGLPAGPFRTDDWPLHRRYGD